jgi:hypothetical protein
MCNTPSAFGENRDVRFLKKLRGIFAKAPSSDTAEMRSLVIMQRQAQRFSEESLRAAAELAWGRKFDGKEDPMYFVSADNSVLNVIKAGPHIIRITSVHTRYADDDEYALSQLPQPEQKRAWTEHHACTFLELFNDLKSKDIPDAEAYASLARLALQLSDPNCTAIFVPIKNLMLPNDGTAEQGLRLLINKELPTKR